MFTTSHAFKNGYTPSVRSHGKVWIRTESVPNSEHTFITVTSTRAGTLTLNDADGLPVVVLQLLPMVALN